jgi:Fe-S-cluster containining protein
MNDQMELCNAVEKAAQRPEGAAAVASIYNALQQAIDAQKPVCLVSGRCCRFEEFGHRLYVTTLELAAFVRPVRLQTPSLQPWDGSGCPFQRNKLCTVHAFRPFGCRIFFCDATATAWQNQQYELFHRRLKDLHVQLDVPYFYVEWREALAALGWGKMTR